MIDYKLYTKSLKSIIGLDCVTLRIFDPILTKCHLKNQNPAVLIFADIIRQPSEDEIIKLAPPPKKV